MITVTERHHSVVLQIWPEQKLQSQKYLGRHGLPWPLIKSAYALVPITPVLGSLHRPKRNITECIESRLLSLTKCSQPPSLHICATSSLSNLLAALALHLSSLFARPSTSSSLRITDRSFRYASRCLVESLGTHFLVLTSLRQPHPSLFISDLFFSAPTTFWSL